ncbi:MAG: S1 RNA-binding domain-containing protein [Bacteroidia bacterium]|jgi:predicted RNA-binding protein (virulence factor B family)
MNNINLRYGDFAYLKVKEITNYGAFLDTGGLKDLLLPFSEQAKKVEQGKGYIIAVIVDEQTERPIATQKYRKYLNSDTSSLKPGQEVDLLVTHFTALGANAIIDNEFEGLIYANQIFKRLKIGDRLKGYVKEIRANGKIDLVTKKQGVEAIDDDAQVILDYLKTLGGFAAIGDFSEPYIIYRELGMSKKAFKKAIGNLYKNKQIMIAADGIRLPNEA